MSRVIAVLLASLLITVAAQSLAQDCSLAVMFEDGEGNLVDQIFLGGFEPFNGHLVLMSDLDELSGFSANIVIDPPTVLLIQGPSGPNGFTNYGTWTQIVAGYTTPLPILEETVLCTLQMMTTVETSTTICVTDAIVGEGPCLGLCSEINPVVASEASTFSAIKAMFDQGR